MVGSSLSHQAQAVADDRFQSDSPDDVARLLGAVDERLQSPSGPTSPALLVIDGWEVLQDALLHINHGAGPDAVLRLLGELHRGSMRAVVTGGRGLLSSRLTSLVTTRVVLRHNDPTDYSLAGLRPAQIPRDMPPGRGLVLPHGHQIQFLADVDDHARGAARVAPHIERDARVPA